jgi:hypothetical protein
MHVVRIEFVVACIEIGRCMDGVHTRNVSDLCYEAGNGSRTRGQPLYQS